MAGRAFERLLSGAATQTPGEVDVFLGTHTTADYRFTNTTGMDIIDCGSLTGFTFIDQVPAAQKPVVDPNDPGAAFGIQVRGGGAGNPNTLRIEAGEDDTLIEITESTSSNDPSPIGTLSGSSYNGLIGHIQSGYNSGSWDQPGIISSEAAGTYTTVGIAEASQVTGYINGVFSGRTLDSTMVLVKFTYGGDANVDGKLNIDDYTFIAQGIAGGWNMWVNGDFNYDGKINIDDYALWIDSNIGNQQDGVW